jgi:hypothetical protein
MNRADRHLQQPDPKPRLEPGHLLAHRGGGHAQPRRGGRERAGVNDGDQDVSIVEPENPLPMGKLFSKRASFSWEFMFSKSMYKTPELASQQTILDRVADLLDEGVLTSTLTVDAGVLEPAALAEAHRTVASGKMVGKLAFHLKSP